MVCCTALMRPNQAETVLSAVAYTLLYHMITVLCIKYNSMYMCM